MNELKDKIYEFGSFRLNAGIRRLSRNGETVLLPPKVYETLLLLVESSGRVITKDEFHEKIWGDAFVDEGSLTVNISHLRKVLSKDPSRSDFIETVPRIGYRFSIDVKEINESRVNSEAPTGELESPNGYKIQESAEAAKENQRITSNNGTHPLPPSGNEQDPIKGSARPEKTRKRSLFLALGAFVAVALSGYLFYNRLNSLFASPQKLKIERVRGTEKTVYATLSPNGEYLAQVVKDSGKHNLQVQHLATNSSIELTPPAEIIYSEPAFSNDGNYIYYVVSEKDQSILYKIPILGGEPKKVLANIAGAVSFSPDGSQFAFIRNLNEQETALVIANTDGTAEQVLSTRKSPEYFSSSGASWSPNGKTIALATWMAKKDDSSKVIVLDLETRQEKTLTEKKWWGLYRATWVSDGSGLVAQAGGGDNEPSQIWFLPFPAGEPFKITNDLNNYSDASLSADSKTLAAIQIAFRTSIWLLPNNDFNQARPISSGEHDVFQFVSWTSDGRILYGSSESGSRDIWIMDASGGNKKQLTANARNNVQPVASPDNRYIVFLSNRSSAGTFNIWRMNIDGTDPVQLTFDNGDLQPIITPDGKWIVYSQGEKDTPASQRTLWKISIDGGDPVQITSKLSFRADISPDGKHIVCWYKPDGQSPLKAAIVPIEGGEPVRLLDIPSPSPLRWTPDGKAISYIRTINDVSNIWNQPVNGGVPRQITSFTSEQITNFDWSNDNHLICSRGGTYRKVVLITNFR